MDRRQFFQGGTALVALALASPVGAAVGPEDARLKALLDAFWDEDLANAPEFATALGASGARSLFMPYRLLQL